MAMTEFQKQVLRQMRTTSRALLIHLDNAIVEVALYASENLGTLTLEELQAEPEFEQITPAELTAMRAGLIALNTAAGGSDYPTGSVRRDLLKVCDQVPM